MDNYIKQISLHKILIYIIDLCRKSVRVCQVSSNPNVIAVRKHLMRTAVD